MSHKTIVKEFYTYFVAIHSLSIGLASLTALGTSLITGLFSYLFYIHATATAVYFKKKRSERVVDNNRTAGKNSGLFRIDTRKRFHGDETSERNKENSEDSKTVQKDLKQVLG